MHAVYDIAWKLHCCISHSRQNAVLDMSSGSSVKLNRTHTRFWCCRKLFVVNFSLLEVLDDGPPWLSTPEFEAHKVRSRHECLLVRR